MSIRKITIGRAPYSDIQLDNRHVYASKRHGEIYRDGNQMIYRDLSSNGTMINRTMVKHRSVPLSRGDIILVAGRYLLDWNQLDALLPSAYSQQVTYNLPPGSQFGKPGIFADPKAWNWGAMGLYPLWGLYNGCWWALPIGIALGWLFPLPNIVFGFFGTRWAMQNGYWPSMFQFIQEQNRWKTAGIIAMCILTLLFIWWVWVYADYLINK